MFCRRTAAQIVADIRQNLSRSEIYSWAIFALRIVVLSVQRKDNRLLEVGFWALHVDDDLLDSRL